MSEKTILASLKPKVSFQWKIGIVICLLSASITSLGFYFFYKESYKVTLSLLQKNLRDVAHVGSMLFDQESREALERLKQRALEEAKFDADIIDGLPLGGTTRTIPPEIVKELHNSDDFKLVHRSLRQIGYATYKEATSLQSSYPPFYPSDFFNGGIATHLEIDLSEVLSEHYGMYLAAVSHEPILNEWPGNPIGNMFHSFVPFSMFNDKIYVHNELIEDDFYQSLTATVPIFDENNETIAVLGLDYSVGPILAKLKRIKKICLYLMGASLFLSLVVSFFISRSLSAPLYKLVDVANKVGANDYTGRVDIKSKDEFGILGQVFNGMLANIQTSFEKLELMNKNLEHLVRERTHKLKLANEVLTLQNKKLEILSTTDQLTEIYNRRYMEQQIGDAINRNARYGDELSLILIDIDYFKLINDNFGHDVGDEVLIKIAAVLKTNLREVDIVGRWGGEEFIVLCQADEYGAQTNAEKLRETIAGTTFDLDIKITASFGYTQYIEGDTVDSLFKRVDQGLYQAKNSGRNRVESC